MKDRRADQLHRRKQERATAPVHHDTVSHALDAPRTFVNIKYRTQATTLDAYESFVQLTLKDHPRLLATRLYDMIKPRACTGSLVQLRRYVRAVRPVTQHEAFFRLSTLPGGQAQVDWGCFGSITIGKTKRPLSCFVMVLGWSRAVFAVFTRPDPRELRPVQRPRLRGVRRRVARPPLRQSQDRCARAQRRSHPLSPTPPRARRPLSMEARGPRGLLRLLAR